MSYPSKYIERTIGYRETDDWSAGNMRKITVELQNWLIVIFLCIYIVSVTLNLCLFDFCGHSINSFVALSSFRTYILILIITEIEVFLLKDITRLRFCLSFWTIHLCIIVAAFFLPNFGLTLVLVLLIISPSIGMINTFTSEWQTFIFPLFCLIEVIQLLVVLLWNKSVKQGT